MINYDPLRVALVHKGKKMSDLEAENGGPLNKRTVSKLRHNKTMNLESIAKVCLFLDVPIEEVVEINRSPREI
jgi:DNA-binding Xre family transcriptional regulator